MKKYKVSYDREACIGAFACVAALPEFWDYADDGMADFKSANFNKDTKKWELIIEEKDLEEHKAAADVCPVLAITIEEISDE